MVVERQRGPWLLAFVVLVSAVAFVFAAVLLDRTSHVPVPEAGTVNTSASIGWLGVCGAIVIFGCYGILIKSPEVTRANVDCMVFQCYYSIATALVSFTIWAVAGTSEGLTLTGGSIAMGSLFGVAWILSQVCAFIGIQALGYAVGPAIWVGVTICVSFVWGAAVFSNPVRSWPGTCVALALLLLGVALAAASSDQSERRRKSLRLDATRECFQSVEAALGVEPPREAEADGAARRVVIGFLSCVGCGLLNGSLMVPLKCFQDGCASIGVQAYTGTALAPLAFLPSLALGILLAQPILFVGYFARILASQLPL